MIQTITSFFLILNFWLWGCYNDKPTNNTIDTKIDAEALSQSEITNKPVEADTLTIVGVGDMMLGTLIPSRNYLPKNNDCSSLLSPTSPILRNADVTFGNLEGVFTDTQSGAKTCYNPKTCYTFGMPSAYVNCLLDAGFDLISIANNHVGDFGAAGRKKTVNTLKEAGLHFAGLLSHPSTVFEKDNVKYGFCAFAPNTGTCSLRNYAEAQRIVKELEAKCDIVIVSFHGGAEGSKHQHITRKDETYLGHNRGNVYEFARKVIDAGADVVFGHGPHVTRAVDVYKDRFIIYSMGNFCTYSRINITGVSGIAPIVKLYVDKNGKFLKGKIFPTYQTKYNAPKPDQGNRVIKKIQELTRQDIPEAPITISDNGDILPKKL